MRATTSSLVGFAFADVLVDEVIGVANEAKGELQVRKLDENARPALTVGHRFQFTDASQIEQGAQHLATVHRHRAGRRGDAGEKSLVDRFFLLPQLWRQVGAGEYSRPAVVVRIRAAIPDVQVRAGGIEQQVVPHRHVERQAFPTGQVLRVDVPMHRSALPAGDAHVARAFIVSRQFAGILRSPDACRHNLLNPIPSQGQGLAMLKVLLETKRTGTNPLRERVEDDSRLKQQRVARRARVAGVFTGSMIPTADIANPGGTASVRECPVLGHRFPFPPSTAVPSPVSRSSCPRIAASSTMNSAARWPASATSAGGGRSDARLVYSLASRSKFEAAQTAIRSLSNSARLAMLRPGRARAKWSIQPPQLLNPDCRLASADSADTQAEIFSSLLTCFLATEKNLSDTLRTGLVGHNAVSSGRPRGWPAGGPRRFSPRRP